MSNSGVEALNDMVATAGQASSFSVVVASFRSFPLLSATLTALAPQCATHRVRLIVSRDAACDDADRIRSAFPDVRVIMSRVGADIPRLRGIGIATAGEGTVFLTEDNCVPDAAWVDALAAGVSQATVAGGGMDNAQRRRGIDWGAYFSEYGFFDAHRQDVAEAAPLLTGANVAYRGDVAADVGRWMQAGAWENTVHARLRDAGHVLRFAPTAVVSQNLHYALWGFCIDRYAHGLDYARTRAVEQRWGGARRVSTALLAPLLAPILLTRLWTAAAGRGRRRLTFVRAAPWTITFLFAWSIGECVGYLTAPRESSAR
jgi:GT2 family glycosyltransferase